MIRAWLARRRESLRARELAWIDEQIEALTARQAELRGAGLLDDLWELHRHTHPGCDTTWSNLTTGAPVDGANVHPLVRETAEKMIGAIRASASCGWCGDMPDGADMVCPTCARSVSRPDIRRMQCECGWRGILAQCVRFGERLDGGAEACPDCGLAVEVARNGQ